MRLILGLILLLVIGCNQQNFTQNADPKPLPPVTPEPLETVNDKFIEKGVETKKVDILFITDNSGSMYEDQIKLSSKLNSFISHLTDVDWQIGVTTTDATPDSPNNLSGSLLTFTGSTLKVINKDTPNAETLFANTVVRNEIGTSDEQPLEVIRLAMEKRNTENSGFFREGSEFVVVILSDEDELSDGPAIATRASVVVEHFKKIWKDSKKFKVFGIIVKPGDEACLNMQKSQGRHPNSTLTGPAVVNYGNLIKELVESTEGYTGSICDSDFGNNLSVIGESVSRFWNEYSLSYLPVDADKVEVSFIPELEVQWVVNGRTLYLQGRVPAGTEIHASYKRK